MENLTVAARVALINAGTNRVGAKVPHVSMDAWSVLRDAGLIGVAGGLTNKGSIVRERIMSEALEEAFGE